MLTVRYVIISGLILVAVFIAYADIYQAVGVPAEPFGAVYRVNRFTGSVLYCRASTCEIARE